MDGTNGICVAILYFAVWTCVLREVLQRLVWSGEQGGQSQYC